MSATQTQSIPENWKYGKDTYVGYKQAHCRYPGKTFNVGLNFYINQVTQNYLMDFDLACNKLQLKLSFYICEQLGTDTQIIWYDR